MARVAGAVAGSRLGPQPLAGTGGELDLAALAAAVQELKREADRPRSHRSPREFKRL